MEHLPRSRHRVGSRRPTPHQISLCVLLQAAIIGRPLRPSQSTRTRGKSSRQRRKGGAARYYNDEDANDPLEDESYYGVDAGASNLQDSYVSSSDDSGDDVDGGDSAALASGSQALRVKACRRSIKKSGVGSVMHSAPRRDLLMFLLDDIRRSRASAGGFSGTQQRGGGKDRAPSPSSSSSMLLDHDTYYEPPLRELVRRLEAYSFPSVGDTGKKTGKGFGIYLRHMLSRILRSPDHFDDFVDSLRCLLGNPNKRSLPAVLSPADSSRDDDVNTDSDLSDNDSALPSSFWSIPGGCPQWIEPRSVFGMFLRRILLEFDRALFDGLALSYDELQAYVKASRAHPSLKMSQRSDADFEDTTPAPFGSASTPQRSKTKRGMSRSGLDRRGESHVDQNGEGGSEAMISRLCDPGPGYVRVPPRRLELLLHTQVLDMQHCQTAVQKNIDNPVIAFEKNEFQIKQLLRASAAAAQRPTYSTGITFRFSSDVQPVLLKALFLRYLNALKHREFGVAIDSLHQYFDYSLHHGPWPSHRGSHVAPGRFPEADLLASLSQQQQQQADVTPTSLVMASAIAVGGSVSGGARTAPLLPGGGPGAGRSAMGGGAGISARHGGSSATRGFPRGRPAVQYASLCLGALHASFGHMYQARQQINESMRIAQHHGDHCCVTHALAWLQHILSETNQLGNKSGMKHDLKSVSSQKKFEPSKASRLLVRAARRASDLGLPHLHALTAFTLAADGVRGLPKVHDGVLHLPDSPPETRSDIASMFMNHGRTLLSAHLPSYRGTNAAITPTASPWYEGPNQMVSASVDSESVQNHIDEPNSLLLIGQNFSATRGGNGGIKTESAGAEGATSHGLHKLLSQRLSWRHGTIGLGGRAMLLRAYGWDLIGHKALSVATLRKQLCSYGAREGRSDDSLAAMCMLSHAEASQCFFRVTEVSSGIRCSEPLVVQAVMTMVSAKNLLVSSVYGVDARRMWTHSACALLFDACIMRGEFIRAEETLRRAGNLCGVLDDPEGDFAAGITGVSWKYDLNGYDNFRDIQETKHVQLAPASPISSLTKDAIYADLQLRWCKLLIARGLHSQAYALANNRLALFCRRRGFRLREVLSRILAATACYEATAAGGVGAEGAVVMAALVEAKRLSQGLGLRKLDSQLLVLQASIELLEGRYLDALRTLDSSWPQLLSNCSPDLQGDAHLCRAKCLLAMVSSATAKSSPYPNSPNFEGQKEIKSTPAPNSKRKRGGSHGEKENGGKSSYTAPAIGNSHGHVIRGRVATEIKAALTDALDAFNAVRKVARIRETLYLKARFHHVTGRHDLRNQASMSFMKIEREIKAAQSKTLPSNFLDTSGLLELAEEWKS